MCANDVYPLTDGGRYYPCDLTDFEAVVAYAKQDLDCLRHRGFFIIQQPCRQDSPRFSGRMIYQLHAYEQEEEYGDSPAAQGLTEEILQKYQASVVARYIFVGGRWQRV